MKLQNANISFNSQGTPVSEAFDDVYFSNDDGVAETQYVFIDGNDIRDKWRKHEQSHFVIGETGFGTGLNIMLIMQQFAEFTHANPMHRLKKLHVISFEKYPLNIGALQKIAQSRNLLALEYKALIDAYPPELSGNHTLDMSTFNTVIHLVLGDINEHIEEVYVHEQGIVDAWFLDGFAPSKNKSMWQTSVFKQLARLSKLNASFATFTAAGVVKRGLQEAGFDVKKRKGFGRKRDMLVGNLLKKPKVWTKQQAPWYARPASHFDASKTAVVVGGGIAGAICALELLRVGLNVRLICADEDVAMGASGNTIGGFYPQLQADASIASQFYAHSFLFAKRWYTHLSENTLFDHDWCGVFQLGFNENTQARYAKMLDKSLWPERLATVVDADTATEITNIQLPYGGLFLPDAGWISPVSLTKSCIDVCQTYKHFELSTSTELLQYESTGIDAPINIATTKKIRGSTSHVSNSSNKTQCDYLVLATADGSSRFLGENIALRLTRGQVEYVDAIEETRPLKTVLCHKGYFTPQVNGKHALGSTYNKLDTATDYRLSDREVNFTTHSKAMNEANWQPIITQFNEEKHPQGRAAIRCSTPDHLPLIGNMLDVGKLETQYHLLNKYNTVHNHLPATVQKNVFLLTGLGSRGLTTAPIAAKTIASQITQTCLPLSNKLLNAVNPSRFTIRSLIRKQD